MPDSFLELRKICKSFPGVQALVDVDFDVQPGEVHALLGENGAGKSTLIKILGGVFPPDSGQIVWKGKAVHFDQPGEALRAGISVIFQEPNLIPNLTVAENIHLGNEPGRSGLVPRIDQERLLERTLELFDQLNLALDPFALAADLSLAERQMVAIVRALQAAADLLIMDEPTSMLSYSEVSQLLSVIRYLRAQGIGLIYVTHRLEEAMQISDRITVLRDGRQITTLTITETNQAGLIQMIAGRPVEAQVLHQTAALGPEVLRLEDLSAANGTRHINLSLQAGEVLGVTGLLGAGGTRLLRAIFGLDPLTSGHVFLDGQPAQIHSPQEAIAKGIGLLPNDRQEQGLVLEMKAQENMTLASLDHIGSGPLIDHQVEDSISQHYARRLDIRLEDLSQKVLFLSGGTQQKVILSRWLASQCRILLLDEPTQGIDVSARLEFYQLIQELTRRGIAMIVVSSNLPELIRLADRIAILHNGQIAAILPAESASPIKILSLASGGGSL